MSSPESARAPQGDEEPLDGDAQAPRRALEQAWGAEAVERFRKEVPAHGLGQGRIGWTVVEANAWASANDLQPLSPERLSQAEQQREARQAKRARNRKAAYYRRSTTKIDPDEQLADEVFRAMKEGRYFADSSAAERAGFIGTRRLLERLYWTPVLITRVLRMPEAYGDNPHPAARLPAYYWSLERVASVEADPIFRLDAEKSLARRKAPLTLLDAEMAAMHMDAEIRASNQAAREEQERAHRREQEERERQQAEGILREADLALLATDRAIFRALEDGTWTVQCPPPVEVGDYVEVHRRDGSRTVVRVKDIISATPELVTFAFSKHQPKNDDTLRRWTCAEDQGPHT